MFQTERLYDILEDSDSNRDQVVGVADAKAGWPEEIGMALFDIITVCLHRKMSKRLPMKEVREMSWVSVFHFCCNNFNISIQNSGPAIGVEIFCMITYYLLLGSGPAGHSVTTYCHITMTTPLRQPWLTTPL